MLDFNKYLMRHGEHWVQDIVERIERNEGINHPSITPLEDRWAALMHPSLLQRQDFAA